MTCFLVSFVIGAVTASVFWLLAYPLLWVIVAAYAAGAITWVLLAFLSVRGERFIEWLVG